MNRNEQLTDDLIAAVFARRADRMSPATVGALGRDILAATASTRQRTVLGLLLSGILPRVAPRTAWVVLALIAALLGVVLALALTGHRQPAPFHTPLLAYIREGDVYLANIDGSNPEVVLRQDGTAFLTVAWSPDGSRLAVDGESGVVLVDPATGAASRVGGTNPVWSADSRQLAVLDPDDGSSPAHGTQLRIVEVATGATARTYAFPAIGDLAWSPDGRWIAATGGSSGASNSLVRLDVTTGEWTELDGPSGMLDSEREPAWSPDSLDIAYIRWGSTTCNGLPLCSTDIFVADADGSHPVRLNSVPGKADIPAWSPDGRWIAYRSVDRSAVSEGNGGSIVDAGAAIVIVHPDGTGERTIPAAGVEAFAWTPGSDGFRFIASAGQGTESGMREVSLDGTVHAVDARPGPAPNLFERTGARFAWQAVAAGRQVPALPGADRSVSATPVVVATPIPAAPVELGGTWPTLATTNDDGCQPMILSTATGAATILASLCDDVVRVDTWAWSPKGSAFAAVRGGTLAIVQRDGRVAMNVAGLTGLASIGWSPDGSWLTAATDAKTWLLRPDGSGLREIPGVATWSADGRTLAVASAAGQLLVGGADGSDLEAIGAYPAVFWLSPDGSSFAYIRDGNAWTARRDGTDPRNVTGLPLGGAVSVAWSADGRWVAVSATHGLWLVRPDGGDKRWFDVGLGETVLRVGWAPGAGRLAVETYTDVSGPQRNLVYLVDPDGAPAVRLDDVTTPSWSPDGRFLAVDSADTGADSRTLVLLNADGSGRHEFPGPAGLDPMVWIR